MQTPTFVQFGPVYNVNSEALQRWRFRAREGLSALTREEIAEYAAAVEAAVKARRKPNAPSHHCPCASGLWENDGGKLHNAMRARQRSELLSAPATIRRARKPHEWHAMYAEAMKEKRKRAKIAKGVIVGQPKRYRLLPGKCATCDAHKVGEMMPSHDPSPRCESGGHAHCSCDMCF